MFLTSDNLNSVVTSCTGTTVTIMRSFIFKINMLDY